MARCFSLRAKGISLTHILNVDAAVGKNCPNRREDVLLVQYLLAVWLATEKDLPKLIPLLATTPLLKVDGIAGNKTKGVINTFETFHQPTVNRDGRIDPVFEGNSRKLFILNQILFFAGGLRGGIPETGTPFPQELIRPLFR